MMNANKDKKAVGLKEIAIVVLLAALTIVVNIITAIPFMTSPRWSVYGGYTLGALICGPIYVLMISKAPRTGTNLLFFGIKALYAAIMGQVATGLVYLIGGIACELIVLSGGYKRPLRACISFAVHNVVYGIGSFTPMLLFADSYAQQLLSAGYDRAIVDAMIHDLTAPSFLALATVLLIAGSALGMFLGVKMLKKHFQPAGIA